MAYSKLICGLFIALCLCCIQCEVALAHPISLSSTVVDVYEDRVDADVQIMLEDLVLYHELEADADYIYSAKDLRAAAQKHVEFVLRYFTVLNAKGDRLQGKLKELATEKIDDAGVAQTELMKKTVNYVLSFPTESPQPFVTFTQTFGGPNAALPALMDLMVLQNGVLKERPTQLAIGRPHSSQFNWKNPPTKEPTSIKELRQQRDQQLRDRLGIATYGGLYSFLYITRFEVRHEVLIPLLTLDQWVPITRKDPDYLEVDEQLAAHDSIERFFQEQATVSIDDNKVAGKLSRLNFFGLDINDFALNAEPRRVSVHQARVGVILSYPVRTTPHDVDMTWNTFSEHAPYLRSIVLVGNEPPAEHYFRVNRRDFHWSGELITTKTSAVAAKGNSLSDESASSVVQPLLRNVYGAFDFRHDSDVYDSLAANVSGDLLRTLFLQVKRSLLMAEQGGALAHVSSVEVLTAKSVSGSETQTVDATWQVSGTVEHWGHVHTRQTEYRGRLGLVVEDGDWKLHTFRLLGEKRIKFDTSIRGYDRN